MPAFVRQSVPVAAEFATMNETMKQRNKYLEADKEGYIRTYPSIHEQANERGIFRQLIKLLKRQLKRKGYSRGWISTATN
jgi:hypothetical protein